MRSLYCKDVLSIIYESIDLSPDEIELTILSSNEFLIQLPLSGEAIEVIADESSEQLHAKGLHFFTDEYFDEYMLFDLIERAYRNGFIKVFLHPATNQLTKERN